MKAFLDAVNQHRIPRLGPLEYIQVQKLLDIRADLSRSELRAGLASLLAMDREQWDYIVHLFDLHFPVPEDGQATPHLLDKASLSPTIDTTQDPLSDKKSAKPKRTFRWQNVPRTLLLVMVVLLLGLSVGVSVRPLLKAPELPLDIERRIENPASPPEESEQQWRRTEFIPEQSKEIEITPPARSFDLRDGLAIGLSGLLVLLGLRWLLLPRMVEYSRQKTATDHRQHVAAERKRLAEAAERNNAPIHLTYQVETHPPLDEATVDDAASILGRLFQGVSSDDLNVPVTLRTSINAGGRFIPVYADRNVAREFVVLVDTERYDNPWLSGINWLLDRWETLGVRFARFDYRLDSFYLADHASGKAVTLQSLARHSDGDPVLIVSRALSTEGYKDRAEWVDEIDAWPVKAWLDLDPRPMHERRTERSNIRAVERLGFQRFPFSQAGLLALARYLVEDGQGVRSPAWESLAPLDDPIVAQYMPQWALLAALVPDASWDQLDAIRRHFPELSQAFPDTRYVQRLIEWVSRADGGSCSESEDGRTLVLSNDLVNTLICQQREDDAEKLENERLEVQGRQLLLKQLDATRPEDELLQHFWEVKRVSHMLALEPGQALELLQPVLGTAAEAELLEVLETELDRGRVAEKLDTGERDQLTLILGKAAQRVRLGELFGGLSKAWVLPGVVVAAAVVIGLLVGRTNVLDLEGWLLRPSAKTVAVVTPATYKVEQADSFPVVQDTLKGGSKGPLMVMLPAGTFLMGSPESEEGRWNDESAQHGVRISRAFAIGKYEVTFAEYDRFAEETKRGKPEDKSWGRGNRPVIYVSWEDAVAYAEWLSEQTGQHYRLPTEAEWEYAARAGTQTAHTFGDEADKLAEYGWYSKNSKGQPHPVGQLQPNAWGLHDMHGNVYEWVQDWWSSSYAPEAVTDSQGPSSGSYRVIRGCSWHDDVRHCRSAYRLKDPSAIRGNNSLGFRLLRTAK